MSHTIQLNAAISIFEDNLNDIKESVSDNILFTLSNLEPWPTSQDPEVQDVLNALQRLEREQIINPRTKTIKRIVSYQQHKTAPKHGQITDQMIERARETPIKELWESLVGQVRHRQGHCPFHDDQNPSVSVGKYNRYNCFGCGAKGSTIDLVMNINNLKFIDAVKFLLK